jgi:hypothetical protein
VLGTRVTASFVVGALVSIVAAGPGGAQETPEQVVTVNPSSAYPGQPFDVAGTGCAGEEGTGTRVVVALQHVDNGNPTAWGYQLSQGLDVEIDDNGDWSVTVAIPVDDPRVSEVLDPDDDFEIDATCHFPCVGWPGGDCQFFYEGVPFDVLPIPDAEPEPTTSTTTPADPPTAPSSTTGSPAVVPAARPATPVAADPTYTG